MPDPPFIRDGGNLQPLPAKTEALDRPHLKVVGDRDVAPRGDAGDGALSFRQVYEDWFDDVVRWLYALGAPAADTEDLAQEIFLVVRRRLREFTGGNLAGWLYRISQLTVRDHRRRAWFKHLVRGRKEIDMTEPSPERSYEAVESRRRFQDLVGRMSEKRRTTLVLFEIEGYSGEEIARIQDIPLATVWTRLHHARKEFWKLVRDQHLGENSKWGDKKTP